MFKKDDRTIPGVIFVARVGGESAPRLAKHDDARWVLPNKLGELDKIVPNLAEHVGRAFDQWNQWKKAWDKG